MMFFQESFVLYTFVFVTGNEIAVTDIDAGIPPWVP
jgi:hypothetical protein